MTKRLIFILIIIFNTNLIFSQKNKRSFTFSKSELLLDKKPIQLIAGELHPARIPRDYWRHRIQMTKAMGCNAISAYLFWNFHETKPGIFDFDSDNHNVAAFIRICHEEGMLVLLRPGPYVCAEWDFGGIPPYLLKIPDLKIRCMDTRYMFAVERYIKRLSKEIRSLQITSGGPIIMLQLENEYGSFGNDRIYMKALKKIWQQNGIKIPFYTADGATPYMLEAGSLPDAAIGLDSGSNDKDFNEAYLQNPNVPVFSSETYPGWLTHWGEKWAKPDTSELKSEVEYLLKNKKSFNFYVIHGGTNFGFTAGANAFSPSQYQPDVTSYDYDAPINEQGLPTSKYFMLRNLIKKYVNYPIPDLPPPIKMIEIPGIEMKTSCNLFDLNVLKIQTPQPQPIENFNQNQGLIVYKTVLIGHKSGKLKIWEPHDYALVFLDGIFIDTVFRDGGKWEVDLPKTTSKDPVLEILVEGMGHINFAQFMIDRKGITDRVTLNGMTLMDWTVSLYPMDDQFIGNITKLRGGAQSSIGKHCNFFEGKFKLNVKGDTFFDMTNYSKGMVYINGHNLGRFWNIGPQKRLYCPASWLNQGENEIVIFDFHTLKEQEVSAYNSAN